jgi:hypothetical protein
MKGKKAMVAILLLSIFFSAIMGTLYFKLQSKKLQFNATIGETQLELINTYTEGEKTLFYIDQAAKYSAYKAIYDLALNGGFFDFKCGDYDGYGLWQNKDNTLSTCSPDYKTALGRFMNERLDSYLSKKATEVDIPLENYDFVINQKKGTEIHGIATLPAQIKISCKDIECGVYEFKPSFSIGIDYNLNDYEVIKEKIEKIIEECQTKQDFVDDENLKTCVQGETDSYKGLHFEIKPKALIEGKEDRNFAFTASSDEKMPFNDEEIIYQFAAYITDKAPPPKVENVALEKQGNNVKISWEENKALDVSKYNIYYNQDLYVPKPDDIFNNINQLLVKETPGTSFELQLEPGTYCIAVTAVDEAGNEIKEAVQSVQITI